VAPEATAAPGAPVQQPFDPRAIDAEYEGLLALIESRLNLADINSALDDALQQFQTPISISI